MAGEAVDGRYGARHAVADDPQGAAARRADQQEPDDRSLVDRLLAADDRVFDWGWGDPATSGTDREPPHDIPELWPDERAVTPTSGSDEPRDVPNGSTARTSIFDDLLAGAVEARG
ncbi:MAG: hypothetical protein ACRDXB_01345, partial [Actinomycetes bacterium]